MLEDAAIPIVSPICQESNLVPVPVRIRYYSYARIICRIHAGDVQVNLLYFLRFGLVVPDVAPSKSKLFDSVARVSQNDHLTVLDRRYHFIPS